MLRALVALLLLANLGVFAWGRGWLSPLLAPPMAAEREPERLLQQVRPETVTVLSPLAAAQVASAAAAASVAGLGANSSAALAASAPR